MLCTAANWWGQGISLILMATEVSASWLIRLFVVCKCKVLYSSVVPVLESTVSPTPKMNALSPGFLWAPPPHLLLAAVSCSAIMAVGITSALLLHKHWEVSVKVGHEDLALSSLTRVDSRNSLPLWGIGEVFGLLRDAYVWGCKEISAQGGNITCSYVLIYISFLITETLQIHFTDAVIEVRWRTVSP